MWITITCLSDDEIADLFYYSIQDKGANCLKEALDNPMYVRRGWWYCCSRSEEAI